MLNRLEILEEARIETAKKNALLSEENKEIKKQITENKTEKIFLLKKYIETLNSFILQFNNLDNSSAKLIDELAKSTNNRVEELEKQHDEVRSKLTKNLNADDFTTMNLLNDEIKFLQDSIVKQSEIKSSNEIQIRTILLEIASQLRYYVKELDDLQSSIDKNYKRHDDITDNPKVEKSF